MAIVKMIGNFMIQSRITNFYNRLGDTPCLQKIRVPASRDRLP